MNIIDFFVRFSRVQRRYRYIPNRLLSPLRYLTRIVANKILPIYLDKKKEYTPRLCTEIIVSFTSFPARINNVWQVIETMMRQTYKPKKIYLWLSKEQFPSVEYIPQKLIEQQNEIFEIRFVDGDIRSHKKYYYIAKESPDSLIFLIDDDIYYDTQIIERSYRAHLEHPNCIICNLGSLLTFNADGTRKQFSEWNRKTTNGNYLGLDLMFGSGAGTLFRPNMMHPDLTNIELAKDLTPLADDLWLNAMSRMVNTNRYLLKNGPLLSIMTKNDKKLSTINCDNHKNDEQLANLEIHYGRIFDKL